MRTCTVDGCGGRHEARGLCNLHYARWRAHGDPLTVYMPGSKPRTEEEADAVFKSQVDKSGSCWLWTGAQAKGGYGQFTIAGVKWRTHRFAANRAGMDIEDKVVRHACDTPACVRPDHLRVGTVADNIADMVAKGRQARQERHGSARLTKFAVFTMRCLRIATGLTYEQIGLEFDVTASTARAAIEGRTWGALEW